MATDKGRPVCPFHCRPVENSLSALCQDAWPYEAGPRRNVRGRRDQECQHLTKARGDAFRHALEEWSISI